MKTALAILTILSFSLAGAACGKKDGDGGGDTPTAGGGGGGGAAAPAEEFTWKPVGGLGIEAEVPADANIDDNTEGAGFPTATIWASPTTFVRGDGELSPLKDMEGTKAEVQKDPNPFKKFTKEEETEDGWHLEFELASMMDEAPIYGVKIRRSIDGNSFDCGSNTRSAEERAKVIKICTSLRKAN